MPEIVPAIIAKSFDELKEKIRLVEPSVKAVQLDVMDGFFVPNKTWPFDSSREAGLAQGKPSNSDSAQGKIADLNELNTDLFLEAHLMIENPHRALNEWLASPVRRIILHWEALEKIHNHELLPYKTQVTIGFPVSNLAEEIHRHNKEFGIAINPETPVSALDNFLKYIDMVLLMSVKPGFSGQEFQENVIPRLRELKAKSFNGKIGVDGGINLDNCKKLADMGADLLAVGSGIFSQKNPTETINNLNKKIKGN